MPRKFTDVYRYFRCSECKGKVVGAIQDGWDDDSPNMVYYCDRHWRIRNDQKTVAFDREYEKVKNEFGGEYYRKRREPLPLPKNNDKQLDMF